MSVVIKFAYILLIFLQQNIQTLMDLEHSDADSFYKIIVVGDASVGKTNLIYVFDKGRKPLAANPTIGVQFTSKTIALPDNRRVRAQIWDTAGQEQFRAVTMNLYRGSVGALIVYDITNRSSFEHVKEWLAAIHERADSSVEIGLIGHKADSVRRVVGKTQAEQFARNNKLFYYETSFNNPETIRAAFFQLLTKVADTQAKRIKSNNLRLENRNTENQSGCKC